MLVERMRCQNCGTAVESAFEASPLVNLSPAQQEFVEQFVLVSGSLKEMAERLGISYPTVRARLDRIIDALKEPVSTEEQRRAAVLTALEEKRLSPEEAAHILKVGRERTSA
jgi:hypothetical protein